jgi:hypothetical protein
MIKHMKLPTGTTYDMAKDQNNKGLISDLAFRVFAIAWSQNKSSKLAHQWRTCQDIDAYKLAIEHYPHCFGV